MAAKKTDQVTPVPEAAEPEGVQADEWADQEANEEQLLEIEDVELDEGVDEVEEGATDEDMEDSEALDELEAEELEMLTEDEASEVIRVDEVAEMRAIRREEMELDVDAEEPKTDEFVCRSCFLLKRTSQLADKRKMLCTDCAA